MMDRIMKYIFTYLSVIILTIYFTGCSELETNIEMPKVLTVHGEGVLDSSSPYFHGKLISNSGWDMIQCKQCHGNDYAGGVVNESCLTCHNQPAGPENCSTCHGSETSPAPPRDLDGNTGITDRGVGAHQVHLSGSGSGKILSCAECHTVPGSVYVPGHVDSEGPAEVIMNNYLANVRTNEPSTFEYDPGLPLFIPDPAYNYSNQSCANTYCHGYFKNGNLGNAPSWTDPASAECGTCHGDPSKATAEERALPKILLEGGTHPYDLNCSYCHGGVVDANLNIINPSKHIDGLLNLYGNDINF
jgi:predicted CxxxxCH...CXXCH cytochrome family protein